MIYVKLDIDIIKFPKIIKSSETVGAITDQGGGDSRWPVVAGGGDQSEGLMGLFHIPEKIIVNLE